MSIFSISEWVGNFLQYSAEVGPKLQKMKRNAVECDVFLFGNKFYCMLTNDRELYSTLIIMSHECLRFSNIEMQIMTNWKYRVMWVGILLDYNKSFSLCSVLTRLSDVIVEYSVLIRCLICNSSLLYILLIFHQKILNIYFMHIFLQYFSPLKLSRDWIIYEYFSYFIAICSCLDVKLNVSFSTVLFKL